ncbi:helix-turn-helix domain-containing protein [Oricola sp.]|uniref:helix-turn-helix domain-containing protein n=1 Tax=Oricola sp. TaxID=1979950 RepID=UPI0025FE24FE|nr:helix-turn-helix domain-containing protein [Oricola sp.]MCI5075668.1 helix-turn-helix domain-containing protein [Oricola sp.]
MKSWKEIEDRRAQVGLSRAEMCRRAGISESTVFKGLQRTGTPSPSVRRILAMVLRAAEVTGETQDKPHSPAGEVTS